MANPLGAIPHLNLSQLRERETERMTRDITRLRDGCFDEIRFWGGVRKQMLKAALYAPNVEELRLTKLFLQGASNRMELRALEECTDEAILSSMVRIVDDVDFPRHPTHTQHHKSNISKRIIEYLGIPEGRLDNVRTRQIFYLTRSALTKELVAAF
ncbi:hypothetical protein NDK50_01525 [Paraburkholderia bryophila]|uniref:hypothetical protein n=1 Tax=Paraburkholderia bryophila TaxID=420952 RepID=UPI0023498E3F|nr:hypothetical protein [Paraburkholderia bryophila]WCM20186.1 hypothetical protein NDK50_01525 [Paraburkholderia bryophila]